MSGTSYYGLSADTPEHTQSGQLTATGAGGTLTQSTANNTGNLDGFYLLLAYNGNVATTTGPTGAANGSGWWLDASSGIEGTTVPAGTWETKVSLYCSDSSAPTGILTVRWWRLTFGVPTFNLIGSATAASRSLAAGWNDFDLSASIGSVTFNPGDQYSGDTLYVDFVFEQTSGGISSTNLYLGISSTSSGVAGGSSTHGMEVIVPTSAAPTNVNVSDASNAAVDAVSVAVAVTVSDASHAAVDAVGVGGVPISVSDASNAAVDAVNVSVIWPVPSIPPKPMPRISLNAPAYANTTDYVPSNADDDTYANYWRSVTVPTTQAPVYLIYDLSHVPATQRQLVVANVINEIGNYRYDLDAATSDGLPVNYTIDLNNAAGGNNAQPGYPYSGYPGSGWYNAVTVTGNNYFARTHVFNMQGANWLRFQCTQGFGTLADLKLTGLDIHDAHLASSDQWLVLGDSIVRDGWFHETATVTTEWGPIILGCISRLVSGLTGGNYFPATVDGGDFGWDLSPFFDNNNGQDAASNITALLNNFSGGFVVLGFGTNDANQTGLFTYGDGNCIAYWQALETCINAAVALNNKVIWPKIPWGSAKNGNLGANANVLNEYTVTQLGTHYPGVLIGPDFWSLFNQNQSLIQTSDGIHPTLPTSNESSASGYEEMHALWSQWMLENIYITPTLPADYALTDAADALYTLSDSDTDEVVVRTSGMSSYYPGSLVHLYCAITVDGTAEDTVSMAFHVTSPSGTETTYTATHDGTGLWHYDLDTTSLASGVWWYVYVGTGGAQGGGAQSFYVQQSH